MDSPLETKQQGDPLKTIARAEEVYKEVTAMILKIKNTPDIALKRVVGVIPPLFAVNIWDRDFATEVMNYLQRQLTEKTVERWVTFGLPYIKSTWSSQRAARLIVFFEATQAICYIVGEKHTKEALRQAVMEIPIPCPEEEEAFNTMFLPPLEEEVFAENTEVITAPKDTEPLEEGPGDFDAIKDTPVTAAGKVYDGKDLEFFDNILNRRISTEVEYKEGKDKAARLKVLREVAKELGISTKQMSGIPIIKAIEQERRHMEVLYSQAYLYALAAYRNNA